MMNTTDVSLAQMIAASGPFQAEKQMLPGSLNHEGHVMHHSVSSCHHDPTAARQPLKKLQQRRSVFFFFFSFAVIPGKTLPLLQGTGNIL